LRDLPLVGDVRGSHFMMCTEYVANKKTREVLPDGINVGKRISDHCEKHGLLIRPLGHLNIMSPPLVMTETQIDELVAGLSAGIRAAADDLVREGHRID
jgi:adenosylmethionine-8-amino-7-oxononanoate aminotransferase